MGLNGDKPPEGVSASVRGQGKWLEGEHQLQCGATGHFSKGR